MPAHGVPRFFRRMRANRLQDRLVFFLDAAKILPRAVRIALEGSDAMSGNDEAAEKIQKLAEAAVLRRGRDRLMESKNLLDRAIAAGDGATEDALRLADRLDLRRRGARARNRGGFRLHRHAQLEDIEHAVE